MNRQLGHIRMVWTALLAVMLLATAPIPATHAAAGVPCSVRNVTQDTRGSSFRRMVAAAHRGDVLRVRGTCTGGVTIRKDLVIRGVGPGATLSGRLRYRVLNIAQHWGSRPPNVRIRDIRIVRGYCYYCPGTGIRVRNATVTLIDSVVTDNGTEDNGGGIDVYPGGTLTLRRSVVRGNEAWETGGGLVSRPGSTVTLIDSVVRDNSAGEGGGIFNGGDLTLIDSSVRGNFGSWVGGIINRGSLSAQGSSVTGNTSRDDGGGIYSSGPMVLRETTVSGNTAADEGGGIYLWEGADASLADTRVTANHAREGGGIFADAAATLILTGSSAVTGNDPNDCVGTPAC